MKKKSFKNIKNNSKIKILFDSTKTTEYKGAHSIGCKN